MNALAFAAVVVIVVLLFVAIYYHVLLHRKNKSLISAQPVVDEQMLYREKTNIKSIEIIARAVIEQQVTMTEASIRINVLLQALELDSSTEEELSVFRQLSEATAHIPILDKWKALSRTQKHAFDLEREEIESRFHDFVISAAKKISQEKILG